MQRPLRRGIIVVVASIIAAAAAPAAAQPDSSGNGQVTAPPDDPHAAADVVQEVNRAIRRAQEDHPALIDLDFKGGTLAEFVDAVRAAAAPRPVNVMFVADASADRPMPAVTFRQVSIDNALDAIGWVTQGEQGQYQVVSRESGGGQPIYVIHYEKQNLKITPMMMQGTPLAAQVQVFMIRDLIEAPAGAPADPTTILQADSLLTAVDAVLASVPEYVQKPTVRFHPESATLIVTAPQEQLNAIRDMLQELQDNIEERRDRAFMVAQRVNDAEMRLRRAEVEIQATMGQLEAGEKMVQGLQSHLETLKGRSGLDVAKTDIEAAEREMVAAQSQLAQLRAQLQMKQIEHQVAQSDLDAARQGVAQPPAAAEAVAANYRDPVVLRARPETIAIIEAIRNAAPAGGLPTINTNTDEGLTVTATAPQHAILHAAVEAMKAAAGETGGAGEAGRPGQPSRPAKNHRE